MAIKPQAYVHKWTGRRVTFTRTPFGVDMEQVDLESDHSSTISISTIQHETLVRNFFEKGAWDAV